MTRVVVLDSEVIFSTVLINSAYDEAMLYIDAEFEEELNSLTLFSNAVIYIAQKITFSIISKQLFTINKKSTDSEQINVLFRLIFILFLFFISQYQVPFEWDSILRVRRQRFLCNREGDRIPCYT